MSRTWIALLIASLICSGTEVFAQGRCQHGGSSSLATPYLGGATLANPLYQQAYMQQYYLQQMAYQQQAYSQQQYLNQQATMAQNQLAREEEQARQAKLAKRDERRAAERDRREAAKERVRQKNAEARLTAGK